jgi:hypothetical protein
MSEINPPAEDLGNLGTRTPPAMVAEGWQDDDPWGAWRHLTRILTKRIPDRLANVRRLSRGVRRLGVK